MTLNSFFWISMTATCFGSASPSMREVMQDDPGCSVEKCLVVTKREKYAFCVPNWVDLTSMFMTPDHEIEK